MVSPFAIRTDLPENAIISRFVSFEEIQCIFQKRRIRLTRAILWHDQLEGKLVDQWIEDYLQDAVIGRSNGMNQLATVKEHIAKEYLPKEKRQVFATSWTKYPVSDEMYAKYSPNGERIVIHTTVGKLKVALSQVMFPDQWKKADGWVRSVVYLGENEKPNYGHGFTPNVSNMFLFKDAAKYLFEKEVRGLISRNPDYPPDTQFPVFPPLQAEQCPSDYLFAPIEDNFIESVTMDRQSLPVFAPLMKKYPKIKINNGGNIAGGVGTGLEGIEPGLVL